VLRQAAFTDRPELYDTFVVECRGATDGLGMKRRAPGTREAEVLAALWSADGPLSAEDVRGRLDSNLAHTTVATSLTRLWEKGAVRRELTARGYSYQPVMDHADLTARRMQALLDDQTDRSGVLSRFVARLDRETLRELRRALQGDEKPRSER
jgi:predicted transcriptional regulator